jgi:CheY-like chemotaxis protein
MPTRSDIVILLAEDDENDVQMFRRAFQQLAIDSPVQVVSNGEEALAYFKGIGRFSNRAEFPLPDILLLDLKMPRKNGFEVLEWLRGQERLRDMRIVVLTTSADKKDIQKAYQLGAASFITKPLDFAEFREAMSGLYAFWKLNRPGIPSRGPEGSN